MAIRVHAGDHEMITLLELAGVGGTAAPTANRERATNEEDKGKETRAPLPHPHPTPSPPSFRSPAC